MVLWFFQNNYVFKRPHFLFAWSPMLVACILISNGCIHNFYL